MQTTQKQGGFRVFHIQHFHMTELCSGGIFWLSLIIYVWKRKQHAGGETSGFCTVFCSYPLRPSKDIKFALLCSDLTNLATTCFLVMILKLLYWLWSCFHYMAFKQWSFSVFSNSMFCLSCLLMAFKIKINWHEETAVLTLRQRCLRPCSLYSPKYNCPIRIDEDQISVKKKKHMK